MQIDKKRSFQKHVATCFMQDPKPHGKKDKVILESNFIYSNSAYLYDMPKNEKSSRKLNMPPSH